MARQLKIYPSYSVFVGRLSPDTKKTELRDLFEGCGEIVDVVVLDNANTGQHYAFVRFTNKDSAFCAVNELNHWVLNGSNIIVALEKSTILKIEQEAKSALLAVSEVNGWVMHNSHIVVELSKETVEKIKQEKEGISGTTRNGYGPRKTNDSRSKSAGTNYITDAMYWARLQESVTAINIKHSSDRHLSMTKLADDIDRVKDNRCTRLWGSVNDATTSFSQISSNIMQRCRAKGEEERGKKNCAEFMSALRTIMKEIETVLGSKQDCHAEEIDDKTLEEMDQLAIEGKLVREVNEELDEDQDSIYSDVDIEGKQTKNTERQCGPMKRLSDASVQTVDIAEDDGTNVPDCLPDREVVQSKFVQQSKYSHAAFDRLFDCEDELLDPAIIDFHMSQIKEIEKREKRREIETDEFESTKQTNIVEDLFTKMRLENDVVRANLERSDSRESSLSDEGIIDDSGVESDCFGGVKGRMSLDSKWMNGCSRDKDGRSRRVLHSSASEPSLKQFDLDQYLKKNRGRGSISHHVSEKSTTPVVGRGMLTNIKSLKYPVGRGHFT